MVTPHLVAAVASPHLIQGDILKQVEVPLTVGLIDGDPADVPEVRLVKSDWVLVLTQDCDLDLDWAARHQQPTQGATSPPRADRILRGILVAPGYPKATVFAGTHIPGAVALKSSGTRSAIENNEAPQWYYVPALSPLIPDLVFELKLFSSVPPDWAETRWLNQRVATLQTPWKEHATRRFAEYFSRIALP